jgi:hypothetical protein
MSIEANAFDFVENDDDYRPPGGLFDDPLSHARQSSLEHLILGDVPTGKQPVALPVELNGWPKGQPA